MLMLVKFGVPPLNQFSKGFHSIVTGSNHALILRDIADLPVGNVHRSLNLPFIVG